MKNEKLKKMASELLSLADIEINGQDPWDIQVHDDRFYGRVLGEGSVGLGESYMDGWWSCGKLDEFFYRVLRSQVDQKIKNDWEFMAKAAWAWLFNMQSKRRAFKVGEEHYDTGNDLYKKMLDDRMVYTCAYWGGCKDLNGAQEAKLKLTCEKLELKPGMRILDIGCGWGSLMKYAAENYGVEAVGVTVSKEQAALGEEACKGLPIEFRLQDYREINEKFDRVVSLGMFEHVGSKNYREYMKVANRCLKDGGLFLLHTFGNNKSVRMCDPWFDKYIFPGGMVPSIKQVGKAAENLFVMEDWHNFGESYDLTLMAWHKNFVASWPEISKNKKYTERFYKMWEYYLLSLAGSFRARRIQLWQIVFSKDGVVGGYKSIR